MKSVLLLLVSFLTIGAVNLPLSSGQTAQKTTISDSTKELGEADRLGANVVSLFSEGKYDEALSLAKQVLEIRERNLPPDDDRIVAAVVNLAEIYKAKKKLSDARSFFERALSLNEKKHGPENAKVADVLARMGLVHFGLLNYSEAENAFQRALSIREKLFGAESIKVAESLHDLAEFYRYRGDLKRAEPIFDRALMIMRKLPRGDAATQRLLEHYSCVYYQNGEAEKLKDLWRKYLPKENPDDSAPGGVPLGGGVLNGRAISLARPNYPEEARRGRDQGVVIVAVTIDENGKVIMARDMCGTHPRLAGESISAAYRSRFSPTTLSGQPVKVTGVITYQFVAR